MIPNISTARRYFSAFFIVFTGVVLSPAISPMAQNNEITPPVVAKDSFTPTTIPANNEFFFTIQSYSFTCGTKYSHKSISIENNKITLAFLPVNDPYVICVSEYRPYGPQFKINALKAGEYNVYIDVLKPCMVDTPKCQMASIPQFLGVLRVNTGTTKTGFVLSPSKVKAGTEFKLQLLNNKYDCTKAFYNLNVRIANGRIDLSFMLISRYNIKCVPTTGSLGPVFKIKALAPGEYPVYATENVDNTLPPRTPQYVGFLTVENTSAPTFKYELSPNQVPAQNKFKLSLLSYKHSCATRFTHKKAEIDAGGNIHLSYLATEEKGVSCIALVKPYGPTFELEGLKEGKYPVNATQLAACMFSNPACMLKIPSVPAGTLVVKNETAEWQLNPESVKSGQAFKLQILNPKFGNCGHSFKYKSVKVEGSSIFLRYSSVFSPVVCITNITPWGPTFDMKPLEKGEYKVLTTDVPLCLAGDKPACKIPEPEPQAVGILKVGEGPFPQITTIAPSAAKPGETINITLTNSSFTSNVRLNNSKAVTEGDNPNLTHQHTTNPLSSATHIFAELFNLKGMPLARQQLITDTDNYAMNAPAHLKSGLYLLRLHIPGLPPFSRLITVQ